MKFKFLTGDVNYLDYGGKWISNKQPDGSAFVMELTNMHDVTGDTNQDKYYVTIGLVSPADLSEVIKRAACQCFGAEENLDAMTFEQQIEIIHGYGSYATLYQETGNNARELMKTAKESVNSMDVEKELDRLANVIGSTKRDFLHGDVMAGLRRYEEAKEQAEKENSFVYAEADVVDGKLVTKNEKRIDQRTLTSDCWMIQINGLSACEKCQYVNKPRLCGGKNIRKNLLAEKA